MTRPHRSGARKTELARAGHVTSSFVPGQGRAATLWSAIDPEYRHLIEENLMEEETAEPEGSLQKAASEALRTSVRAF